MAVREFWDVEWIQGITVQEDWVSKVSIADTVNFVWWWTVTDVGWVATINIPEWVTWYREDVPAGSATYTFVNWPATSTSFLVFTDSWTLLFSGIDYTYDPDTETITFLSLWANEKAYIWVAHALNQWWGIGDMVKAVYDPTNINSSAFDMDNFIDGTNKHYVSTAEKTAISTALQPNDNISELNNDAGYITGINSTDVSTALWYTPYDASNPAGYITSAWDVYWPNSSTDWNIVVFDWATGKLIKDSWLNIQVSNNPSGNPCNIFYDNGTIYLQVVVPSNILLENDDNLITEDDKNIILEN